MSDIEKLENKDLIRKLSTIPEDDADVYISNGNYEWYGTKILPDANVVVKPKAVYIILGVPDVAELQHVNRHYMKNYKSS